VTAAGLPPLPRGLELRRLEPADVTTIVALIYDCDMSFLEWAPAGWSPPPAEAGIAKWEPRLVEADRWTRGAFDASGGLVAIASARRGRTDDGSTIEARGRLGALFVHPSRWREGIGAALLRRAVQGMRDLDCETASLETPEQGPARAFYERHGWEANGKREFKDDLGMWEVEYETRLTARDPALT
jgi:GNAT superfamily N-acetyltransferase